jgi:hypothetical protein
MKTIFIIILILIIFLILLYEHFNTHNKFYSLNLYTNNNLTLKPIKKIDLSQTYNFSVDDKMQNFKTANISVIPLNNFFLCVIRITNCYTDFNLEKIFQSKLNVINYQKLILMDNNFNIIIEKILDLDLDCEDIRLFNYNEKIMFSCNYFDKDKKIFNVMICEFDNNLNIIKIIKPDTKFKMIKNNDEKVPEYIKNIEYLYINIFKNESVKNYIINLHKWEKNWTLVEYKKSIHIIYKWYPLHICKINDKTNELELVELKNMPDNFAFCRGSTNGFKYENTIWFIVHKTTNYKQYYHMLVIFDKSMNLKGYIYDFKFEDCIIEFCLGLIIQENQIIITYSTYDANCKIAIYDKKYILSLVKWI